MKRFSIHIGGRIYKTVIAVFLCFVIDTLRNNSAPFYAAIAAIYCIQPNRKDSFRQAKNREIATIIGGIWGMLFLLFERYVYTFSFDMLRYAVLSVLLIPIILVTLWTHQEKGTFLTCVIFLCITITHMKDVSPVSFAITRTIDTTIGIVIALVVNLLPFKTQPIQAQPKSDSEPGLEAATAAQMRSVPQPSEEALPEEEEGNASESTENREQE